MADAILVINAGSSSIKFSVYVAGDGDVALHVQGQIEGLFTAPRFTATNSAGALDPGLMLYLMDQRKMDARAIEHLIYKESGLLGVSGISSDMRALRRPNSARTSMSS